MAISCSDFEFIRKLLRQRSALLLEPGKEYLVESRLEPLVHQEGLRSLQHLVEALQADPTCVLHQKVVEAMTISETSFFRDAGAFDVLKAVALPGLLMRRTTERSLRIWCAACSSGQEPYSIALLIREDFPLLATWNLQFIASDISGALLARAREGRYTQLEINRGMPTTLLEKYFAKRGGEWQVRPDVRRMVEFWEHNLAEAWPALPPMDLIFMRNVLIYFDVTVKKDILARIRRVLRPDGYLFLGGAETTINLDGLFEPLPADRAVCFRLR